MPKCYKQYITPADFL